MKLPESLSHAYLITGGSGETRYYTSGDAAAFSAAASALLGQEIQAEHVPAMEI